MLASLVVTIALQAAPMQGPPMQAGTSVPQQGSIRSDAPAAQPTTAPIAIRGMPIVNANGNAVGTVAAATAGAVVVDTGAQRMSYPASRFKAQNGALVFELTQSQVEGEALRSQGDLRARLMTVLIPGAAVRDPSGTIIGTIEGVGAQGVTVSGGSRKTAVPASAFSMDASGGLVIPISAAEFNDPR